MHIYSPIEESQGSPRDQESDSTRSTSCHGDMITADHDPLCFGSSGHMAATVKAVVTHIIASQDPEFRKIAQIAALGPATAEEVLDHVYLSSTEQIAVGFALGRDDLLPGSLTRMDAWLRLDERQRRFVASFGKSPF